MHDFRGQGQALPTEHNLPSAGKVSSSPITHDPLDADIIETINPKLGRLARTCSKPLCTRIQAPRQKANRGRLQHQQLHQLKKEQVMEEEACQATIYSNLNKKTNLARVSSSLWNQVDPCAPNKEATRLLKRRLSIKQLSLLISIIRNIYNITRVCSRIDTVAIL